MLFFIESCLSPIFQRAMLQEVRTAGVRNKLPPTVQNLQSVSIFIYCHRFFKEMISSSIFHLYLPKCQIKEMSQKRLSRIFFRFVTLDLCQHIKLVDKAFGKSSWQKSWKTGWALRNWTQKGDSVCMYVLIRVLFWDTLKILDLMQSPRGSSEQE